MPAFSIFLPRELYERVLADARARGVSLSRRCREIIEEYYAEEKRKRRIHGGKKGY